MLSSPNGLPPGQLLEATLCLGKAKEVRVKHLQDHFAVLRWGVRLWADVGGSFHRQLKHGRSVKNFFVTTNVGEK